MRSELADLIAFEIGNSASGGLVRPSADGKTPVFESDDRIAAAILAAGYRKPKVIQYMVVTQDGGLYDCNFGLNRDAAQAVADQATADAAALGMEYTYRVAEVIEPADVS